MTNSPSKLNIGLAWTGGILFVVCLIIMSTGWVMAGGSLAAPSPGAALAGAQPVSAPTNEKKEKLGMKLFIVGCVSVIILWTIGSIYDKSLSKPRAPEAAA